MANINTLNSSSAYSEAASLTRSSASAQPATASTVTDAAQATGSGGVQLSGMARLLSEAATRAAARDASTDRSGLKAIADATIEKLLGPGYNQNKATYDAEVPDSTDPQRLALLQLLALNLDTPTVATEAMQASCVDVNAAQQALSQAESLQPAYLSHLIASEHAKSI